MKPLNLIALLLFLGGAVWALTRSERAVREIQNAYFSAIGPFLKAGTELQIRAHQFTQETRHSKELEVKLAETERQLDRLRPFENRCRQLEKENNDLRKALAFKQSAKFDVVAARILRRNPATWWQTVEIDVGSSHGVSQHLAVLSNGGLVGKIDRVFPTGDRSSVLLLTDEACLVSARVEGSPEVGILSGQRGDFEGTPKLRLKYLSLNASVRPGQRVFTTGRGGIFPANVLLGYIESVQKDAQESEAIVRPSVNFADPGAVFVVLSNDT